MTIVIEFIGNTNFNIQMWIIKISCKHYTHKTKDHKILKPEKSNSSKCKNLNNKKNLNFKYWLNPNVILKKKFIIFFPK